MTVGIAGGLIFSVSFTALGSSGEPGAVHEVAAGPGDVQTTVHDAEATRTEPDKNTDLILGRQDGPDPDDDYGTHFPFQGRELGETSYITRVNLDADPSAPRHAPRPRPTAIRRMSRSV